MKDEKKIFHRISYCCYRVAQNSSFSFFRYSIIDTINKIKFTLRNKDVIFWDLIFLFF